MTVEDFLENVSTWDRPSDRISKPLQALWYAEKGDWLKAHLIVQDEPSIQSSWVHAHLHREERDEHNALYWYRQARRQPSTQPIEEERRDIIRELVSHEE